MELNICKFMDVYLKLLGFLYPKSLKNEEGFFFLFQRF